MEKCSQEFLERHSGLLFRTERCQLMVFYKWPFLDVWLFRIRFWDWTFLTLMSLGSMPQNCISKQGSSHYKGKTQNHALLCLLNSKPSFVLYRKMLWWRYSLLCLCSGGEPWCNLLEKEIFQETLLLVWQLTDFNFRIRLYIYIVISQYKIVHIYYTFCNLEVIQY